MGFFIRYFSGGCCYVQGKYYYRHSNRKRAENASAARIWYDIILLGNCLINIVYVLYNVINSCADIHRGLCEQYNDGWVKRGIAMKDMMFGGYIARNHVGNNLTDRELRVLKDGDIDAMVSTFVKMRQEEYILQLKCVLKSLKHYLGDEMTLEKITIKEEYEGDFMYNMIQGNQVIYERMKFPKIGKPLLIEKSKQIIEKYEGQGIDNYVFPVFTKKHTTEAKMRNRVIQISNRVSKTLTKVCNILDIKENITWYSARGTFISRMVDAGCSPAVTAEQAGNSVAVIFKHYYKFTEGETLLTKMNSVF